MNPTLAKTIRTDLEMGMDSCCRGKNCQSQLQVLHQGLIILCGVSLPQKNVLQFTESRPTSIANEISDALTKDFDFALRDVAESSFSCLVQDSSVHQIPIPPSVHGPMALNRPAPAWNLPESVPQGEPRAASTFIGSEPPKRQSGAGGADCKPLGIDVSLLSPDLIQISLRC